MARERQLTCRRRGAGERHTARTGRLELWPCFCHQFLASKILSAWTSSTLGLRFVPCTAASSVSKHKCLQHSHNENGPFLRGTSPQQEDHKGAWSAAVDGEAVVAMPALGRRDGVSQRWATTRSGRWFLSPVLPNWTLCVWFSCRYRDKTWSVFLPRCLIWHHCRHTMLHSRHCSQTSANIWHRAQPPKRP